MPKKTSHEQKLRDREIDLAFRASCSGVPIKLMDIPRIYAEGRRLIAAGTTDQTSLRAALATFVENLTQSYA